MNANADPKDPQAELREAINAIFAEYDKPSTTKTYPGQKTRVRRGAAIDQILALSQAREQQLLTELLGELPEKKKNYKNRLHFNNGFNQAINQVVSVIAKYREGL